MLDRWRDSLKAFRMTWSGAGGGVGGAVRVRGGTVGGSIFTIPDLFRPLPGSTADWEQLAGDLLENSVVALCLGWIADNIVEPVLQVQRQKITVEGHPLPALLDQPNPFYDGDALWAATAVSYCAHGNAYWLLIRDERRRLSEIWWAPFWQVTPCWDDAGTEFITHYLYRVNGQEYRLPPEDVLHFRFGIDPQNQRLGLSRLRAVLREVVTDNEAATYMAAILRNMAIPTVIITPTDAVTTVGNTTAQSLEKQYQEKFSGENRGKPLIPARPVRVERLSLSPEELVLDRVRQFPEARICGALRIPALVVGLNVGDQTRTYANYSQARKAAYEDCLMPLGRRLARAVARQLLHELGDPNRERLAWDYSEVAALRDDLTEVFKRNNLAIAGGWMTPNEARRRANLDPLPNADTLADRRS
jgi:HK97 family phage portal protein